MVNKVLLLSIRPEYAEKIFLGVKEVELRRTRPKLEEGDIVVVYASSPTKALIGACRVKKVIQKPLQELWNEVNEISGLSYREFCLYYKGISEGCAIFLYNKQYFSQPIDLKCLKHELENFRPPQSYRYLKPYEISFVENNSNFTIDR